MKQKTVEKIFTEHRMVLHPLTLLVGCSKCDYIIPLESDALEKHQSFTQHIIEYMKRTNISGR